MPRDDYDQVVSDLEDAINTAESCDTIDPDIEGLVIAALAKLEEAKALAEARMEGDE